jgi:hypothetical protein
LRKRPGACSFRTSKHTLPPSAKTKGNAKESPMRRLLLRNTILDDLAMVRRHVARGEQIVAHQREIFARLERADCDTSDAE